MKEFRHIGHARPLAFWLFVVCLRPEFCPVTSTAQAAEAKRPNIIFILADDLGWGDLRCYGHRQAQTPHLDRMAKEGTLFTQFYSSASVCSPSRAAFMTGQFPGRLGIHTVISGTQRNQVSRVPEFVDLKTPFLTRLLKDVGYSTAHFGKWHLGSNARGVPSPGAYGIDDHRTTTTVKGSPTWDDEAPQAKSESTKLIFDETIRFITTNRNKPFYVNVWTRLPHAPLHPNAEQLKIYADLKPDPKLPYISPLQIYLACITDIDTQVGRLFATLKELGLDQDTLVVFSSDNGPEVIESRAASYSGVGSAGPFRGRKRSLYEGGVRVPFIARWPADGGVPAGRVSDAVLNAVDWLPTVCSIAGVEPPEPAARDGENVVDIFRGALRERTKPLFWEWRHPISGHIINSSPMDAIRDRNWKLLMNPDRSRIELYDIPNDPSELLNVAAQHPDIVERLAKQLDEWQTLLPKAPVDANAGKAVYPWPILMK